MSYAAVADRLENPITDCGRGLLVVDLPFFAGLWRVELTEQGLCSIDFMEAPEQEHSAEQLPIWARRVVQPLQDFLAGNLCDLSRLPIDWSALTGTAFQKAIWLTLLTIPLGETRSYQWVGEQSGYPKAARAVGQAVGRNPIPVVIPCHRVIATSGKLGGFMRNHPKGLQVKSWLLELEKTNISL